MNRKAASTLALAIAGGEIALFVATQIIGFLARRDFEGGAGFGGATYANSFLMLLPMLAFPLFGGLIASRRPSNPIGWICLASGAFWFFTFFADNYATYGVQTHPGSVPAPLIVGALGNWVPAVGLLGTFLFLLFPNGRLLSRRWRPIAWLSGFSIVVVSAVITLAPDDTADPSGPPSPLVLHGTAAKVVGALGFVFFILFACIFASVVSLVLRYRRSRNETREQMKWIAFAGVAFAGIYGITIVASILTSGPPGTTKPSPVPVQVLQNLAVAAFAFMPTAAFFAVLRYKLYEIDRIISRTLSYAIVTALLGGTFALIVLVPTALVGSTAKTPGWLVATATLAAFGLFRPLRGRVQGVVDRRFNRARYDTVRTIESFAARLREQVDLDSLRTELCALVHTTMQPTGVSLWIRDSDTPPR
jgi:hypothetical protein